LRKPSLRERPAHVPARVTEPLRHRETRTASPWNRKVSASGRHRLAGQLARNPLDQGGDVRRERARRDGGELAVPASLSEQGVVRRGVGLFVQHADAARHTCAALALGQGPLGRCPVGRRWRCCRSAGSGSRDGPVACRRSPPAGLCMQSCSGPQAVALPAAPRRARLRPTQRVREAVNARFLLSMVVVPSDLEREGGPRHRRTVGGLSAPSTVELRDFGYV
jgi:hypothetical protein